MTRPVATERADAPFPAVGWVFVLGMVFFYGLHLGASIGWGNAHDSAVEAAQLHISSELKEATKFRESLGCVSHVPPFRDKDCKRWEKK